MTYKFSFIVPVFNTEKYLRECLDSLINQTYKDFEIIIVNDASPDGSREIIKNYRSLFSRIIYIENQENKNLFASRIIGAKKAKGDYLLFVDSDDSVSPVLLETINRNLENQDMIAFCHDRQGKKYRSIFKDFDTFKRESLKGCHCNIWGKAIKKEVWDNLYFTDEEINLMSFEDWLFSFKIALAAKSYKGIPESLYFYRVDNICNHTNNIDSQRIKKDIHDHLKVYQEMEATLIHYRLESAEYKTLLRENGYNLINWLFDYRIFQIPDKNLRKGFIQEIIHSFGKELFSGFVEKKLTQLQSDSKNSERSHRSLLKRKLKTFLKSSEKLLLLRNKIRGYYYFLYNMIDVKLFQIWKRIFLQRMKKFSVLDRDPLISVVIPVHNQEKCICDCLNSIVNQTYRKIEIILVDDASTDKTCEIVKRKFPGVRVLRLPERKGAQYARNQGIKEAKGKWIAFQDSDDLWYPFRLSSQVRKLRKYDYNKGIFLYSEADFYDIVKKQAAHTRWITLNKRKPYESALKKTQGVMFQSLLVSKKALKNIGLLDENVQAYQEFDATLSLCKSGLRPIKIRYPLFQYNIYPIGTISSDKKKSHEGYKYIIEKYKDDILTYGGKKLLEEQKRNIQKLERDQ